MRQRQRNNLCNGRKREKHKQREEERELKDRNNTRKRDKTLKCDIATRINQNNIRKSNK